MSDKVFLTESELAARYLTSRRTVTRWRVTGEGPPYLRLGPRRVMYRESDCEAWAASRAFSNRADEQAQGAKK
jgi:predicted DNA-binding transcriptional regulator AlpA